MSTVLSWLAFVLAWIGTLALCALALTAGVWALRRSVQAFIRETLRCRTALAELRRLR